MESQAFTFRSGAGLVATFLAVTSSAAPPRTALTKLRANPAASSSFIENAGQWDSRAQFLSQTKGLNLWITQEGPVFDFKRFVPTGIAHASKVFAKRRHLEGYVQGHVVKMSFVNSSPSAATGAGEQKGKYSYFLGNEKSKWVSGARSFSQVTAERPYDGISIRYSIEQGTPRYDVIVKPGADPSQVDIKIEGADNARVLSNGNLELKTSLGVVEERGLTAYQTTASGRVQVPCRMVMEGNTARFDTGSYDSAKPLIIDPLVASTFLGGRAVQTLTGYALDSANNIYVTGATDSPDFPTTVGAYQSDSASPCFISKFDPTESTLIYSATLGGSVDNVVGGLAVDSAGRAFIAGETASTNFPTTPGAYTTTDPAFEAYAGFVTGLNASGTDLVYSTYLGCATGGTSISGIAVDSSDKAVVTGATAGASFPVTPTAFQTTTLEPSINTCFVTEFNSTGSALVYSTFLGGSGNNNLGDQANAIALDSAGNAVICGQTASTNFPVTAGSYQRVNNNQQTDDYTGFVTKLNSAGTSLVFSTYLGGSGNPDNGQGDIPAAVALDSAGNVTMVGQTNSANFPISAGAYLTTNPEAATNGICSFITRLNPTGTALVYSTFLGGSGAFDYATAVALDQGGDAYVVGGTYESNFPTTTGCVQAVNLAQNGQTGYVSELNSNGRELLYSTYLGGSSQDSCQGVSLNAAGNVVVAGNTESADFPTTTNAFEPDLPAFKAAFVTTLNLLPFTSFNISPNPVVGGGGCTGTISIPSVPLGESSIISLSSASLQVTVPATVSIGGGHSTNTFSVTTSTVTSPTQVAVTALLNGSSQVVNLTLVPAAIASVQVNPGSVVGGTTVTGTVQLNVTPSAGNLLVGLSSNSSAVVVPSTVAVTHGNTSVTFPITTTGVNTITQATISATFNFVTVQTTLTVNLPSVSSVTVAPTTVTGETSSTGTVTLNGPAGPSGAIVALSSTTSEAAVPSSVKVVAGASAAIFTVNTVAVSSSGVATIGASYNSSSASSGLTLSPASLSGLAISVPLLLGGTSATGAVQLASPAGPYGDVVKLSSSTSEAGVPSTVKVAAGATSATFPITTTAVSSDSVATFTATYGLSSEKAQLILLPAPLSSITVSPTSLVGGTSTTVTVTLANIAGPYGNVIKFSTSSPEVTIPATETVPAGQTSYSFSAPTSAVSSSSVITITDTFFVYSQKTTLTLTPAPITSLSFNPTPVVGGQTTTGTVHLSGVAGPAGDVAKLSSNNADATVPATVTVLAGQSSATFTVHTVAVSSSKSVTITATLGTSTVNSSFTISP